MDTSSPQQPVSINHQWKIENQIQVSQDSGCQFQSHKSQAALPSSLRSNLSPGNSGSSGIRPPEDFTMTRKHPSNRKNRYTWTNDTCYLTDDGFQWRKYGQKVIQNEKYPRNYFRCTHKDDQGCLATKQVQRIQQDPPIYRTTYNSHHTCNTHRTIEDIIAKTSSNSNGCFRLVIPSSESGHKESKICCSNSTRGFNLLIPQQEQEEESMEKSSVSDPTFEAASPDFNGGKDLKLLQNAEPLNLTLSL